MSAAARQTIFVIALVLGILWAGLCLMGALPFARWPLSFTIVAAGSMFILLPLAFPALFRRGGQPAHTAPERERTIAGATLVLVFAWIVVILACLVYPL